MCVCVRVCVCVCVCACVCACVCVCPQASVRVGRRHLLELVEHGAHVVFDAERATALTTSRAQAMQQRASGEPIERAAAQPPQLDDVQTLLRIPSTQILQLREQSELSELDFVIHSSELRHASRSAGGSGEKKGRRE